MREPVLSVEGVCAGTAATTSPLHSTRVPPVVTRRSSSVYTRHRTRFPHSTGHLVTLTNRSRPPPRGQQQLRPRCCASAEEGRCSLPVSLSSRRRMQRQTGGGLAGVAKRRTAAEADSAGQGSAGGRQPTTAEHGAVCKHCTNSTSQQLQQPDSPHHRHTHTHTHTLTPSTPLLSLLPVPAGSAPSFPCPDGDTSSSTLPSPHHSRPSSAPHPPHRHRHSTPSPPPPLPLLHRRPCPGFKWPWRRMTTPAV